MTTQTNPNAPSEPKSGEFPFRLSDSDRESKYLTWVRNHSSYLMVGGPLNALGALAIYVRGVMGNLLVIMPYLILVGLLLGWFHHDLYRNPFVFTQWVLLYAGIVFLFFFGYAIGSRYSDPRSDKRPGKTRKRFRVAGDILVAILTIATVSYTHLTLPTKA